MTEENTESTNETTETPKFTVDEFRSGAWRDAISDEEMATHQSLSDYKDFDGFVKSYINQQKLIGGEKVPMPKENWSKKDWDNWNKSYGTKFGYPSEPKEYGNLRPEKLPDGVGYSEAAEDFFKQEAHKNGLTKSQANKIWKSLVNNTAQGAYQQRQQYQAKMNEEFDEMKKEFGAAYEKKTKLAEAMINKVDEDGSFRKWAKETGAFSQPELIKFAIKMAEQTNLVEDTILNDEKASVTFTPNEAKSKLNKIYSDPKHPFNNEMDPAHDDAVKEVNQLMQMAYHVEEK